MLETTPQICIPTQLTKSISVPRVSSCKHFSQPAKLPRLSTAASVESARVRQEDEVVVARRDFDDCFALSVHDPSTKLDVALLYKP